MDRTHTLALIPQCCLFGIPVWIFSSGIKNGSVVLALISFVTLLVFLRIIPMCRGRESLFGFLILTPMITPLNICAIFYLWENAFIGEPFVISGVLWSVVIFAVLFSVEQIVFGVLARFLWPRQLRTRSSKIKKSE